MDNKILLAIIAVVVVIAVVGIYSMVGPGATGGVVDTDDMQVPDTSTADEATDTGTVDTDTETDTEDEGTTDAEDITSAGSVELHDCGPDTSCMNEKLESCTPATARLHTGGMTLYYEIQGKIANTCTIYMKVEGISFSDELELTPEVMAFYQQMDGAEMTCDMPIGASTMPAGDLTDYCSGSYVDLMTSMGTFTPQ